EPTKEVANTIKGLREQLDELRLGKEKSLVNKLLEQGASAEDIREAVRLFREIKEVQKNLDLDKKADDIVKDLRTPIEQLADAIREINELGERLTDEQRMKAIEKARKDIFGESG